MREKNVQRVANAVIAAEAKAVPQRQPMHPLTMVLHGVGIVTGIFVSVSAWYLIRAAKDPEILFNGNTPLEDLADALNEAAADCAMAADVVAANWEQMHQDCTKQPAARDTSVADMIAEMCKSCGEAPTNDDPLRPSSSR